VGSPAVCGAAPRGAVGVRDGSASDGTDTAPVRRWGPTGRCGAHLQRAGRRMP